MITIIYSALVILLCDVSSSASALDYEVPTATIEVYYPKGFQVSIPHEEGITLFAFHGKLNEEMDGLEAGTWARDIVKPKNGRWIFRDRVTHLKLGDTLYYWTYVIYKGLGYREDDGVYVVKEYANTSMTPTTSVTTGNRPTTVQSSTEASASCPKSATFVNGAPRRCAGQLIFEEEFDGQHLDVNKWTVERRIPHAPNYEFNVYLDDVEDVLQLRNGILRIKPKLTDEHFGQGATRRTPLSLGTTCTGQLDSDECSIIPRGAKIVPPYISVQFTTKNKFTFKYGRVEVRAKMPQGMWVFPQLWLEPNECKYGDDYYNSGQMRIAQTRNDGARTDLLAGLVLNSHPAWHSFKLCLNNQSQEKLSDEQFHTYEILWTPDVITFSLDSKEYCRYEVRSEEESFQNLKLDDEVRAWHNLRSGYLPNRHLLQSGTKWAPFDQEFYLLVGEGIGGFSDFHEGKWSEEKPWRNTDPRAMLKFYNHYRSDTTWLQHVDFQIDYIKILY
ncbi:gram-negative bacteria-binding protein 3-like [Musca vetustissima]|uniref:gram-negative bacteria-binding protein 3-like n=1 Tax=Musca vetustissima TaxID=27455 RepID=UPI002AB79255|nr:gram-negative bacteria-binding protein 3-like [Musca vetustissima]